MSKSLKFPVAVHTLAALAIMKDRYISSEELSRSIGTNPVVIRRIVQALKGSGLIESRGGVYGGARLALPAEKISLLDVQLAVEDPCACPVHDLDVDCWIARGMAEVVPPILHEAEAARRAVLAQESIGDVAKRIEAGHRPRRETRQTA